jgi:transposase, IS6 family
LRQAHPRPSFHTVCLNHAPKAVSDRDLELTLLDRGVEVDHTTIFRWIRTYAAELEKRIRPYLRMSNGSRRVDETCV